MPANRGAVPQVPTVDRNTGRRHWYGVSLPYRILR